MAGLEKTSLKNIRVDDSPPKRDAIQVEVPIVPTMPAVSQTPFEFIEIKVEHQSDDSEENSHRDIDHVPVRHSRTDSEDDVPLLRIKTEVKVEQGHPQVSGNRQRACNTDSAPVPKKPKLLDNAHSRKLKKNVQSDAKIIRPTQIRPPVMKKPKLEDTCTAEQMKTEKLGSNIIQTTSNNTNKPVYKLEELFTKIKPAIHYTINIKTPTCNTSNKDELKFKISKNLATDSDVINKDEVDKERPFKCDMCHRSYTIKSHLTDHKRKHTGEKPFECEICHRCFTVSSHLKCHIRTHTGAAKPFKCDVCQRRFTLKNNLRTHSLVHTGEKPYKCHICQRAFTQKIHLRSHIPIHTGDKPFKCDVCDRNFSLKHSLIRHIQVHDDKKYVTGKSDRVTRSTKRKKRQTS